MTKQFTDILDEALATMETEPVTAVLQRYPDHAQTLAPLLTAAEKLGEWQTFSAELAEVAVQPTSNPDWQTTNRTHFLDQIEQLPAVPVSPGPLLRLKGWLMQTGTAFRNRNLHKEQKSMNVLFARAIATAVVIFGLGGGTVVMANDSLPESPLYPVKLMLEETRMNMAASPVEQAKLQIEPALVRMEEMTQLALEGDTVGEAQLIQLQTHLQTALQLAAQTGDTEMSGLLTQMQTMLQNMQQSMTQLGEPVQAMLGEAERIMNQYQEQAQVGLEDPSLFRWRQGQGEDWEPAGNRQQNGPGDGTCLGEDCESVGDQNQFGHDENNANGPNDTACLNNEDCEPAGDANQYGQDADNSGQNGNGDFDGDGVPDSRDRCADTPPGVSVG